MGMKETLIVNWSNKLVEYQGEKLCVVDQFTYKEKDYLYTVNTKIATGDTLEVTFLTREKDDIFEHVIDNALYEELIMITAGRTIAKEIMRKIRS